MTTTLLYRLNRLQNASSVSAFVSARNSHFETTLPSLGKYSITQRFYSSSKPTTLSSTFVSSNGSTTKEEQSAYPVPSKKEMAKMFNERRAEYKKQVSSLRKKYARDISIQKTAEEKARLKQRELVTRNKLERQRLKNIRSAQNALKEEQRRVQRHAEFQLELQQAQKNRDERKSRFASARRLVLQELEQEAPLWLTTKDQIDQVFSSSSTTQMLWARPGGVVGAPLPTSDSEFWRYHSHTWDMSTTYPTSRDLLLEFTENLAYAQANVSETYWNEDRRLGVQELEQKAKLRALVREAGREVLLMKQRSMMQDLYGSDLKKKSKRFSMKKTKETVEVKGPPSIPKAMPAPSLDILANFDAMEEEGVKILLADPTRFFKFEQTQDSPSSSDERDDNKDDSIVEEYTGETLGKPIGLRDPIRDENDGTPYPMIIGVIPEPDKRTEREKKRDERERSMLLAAGSEAAIDYAATGDISAIMDPLDYDELGNLKSAKDLEWEKDLDPDRDAEALATPSLFRYTEDDIDWVVEQLGKKIKKLEEVTKLEKESIRQEMVINRSSDDGIEKSANEGDQENRRQKIERVVDMKKIDSVLEGLNNVQIAALRALENDDVTKGKVTMSSEEIKEALRKVPGLSNEQVQALIELEMSLSNNAELREILSTNDTMEEEKK